LLTRAARIRGTNKRSQIDAAKKAGGPDHVTTVLLRKNR
jgi:hypothetical protein